MYCKNFHRVYNKSVTILLFLKEAPPPARLLSVCSGGGDHGSRTHISKVTILLMQTCNPHKSRTRTTIPKQNEPTLNEF